MKKLFLFALAFVLSLSLISRPDEGMWIPGHISKTQYMTMKKLGLRLSQEEIYSINNSSIKDAIFQLIGEGGQGFCTGEMVSPKGLMFTNHHCGYEAIANLSSTESNYLDDGYWAKSLEEEIPVPGVSVSRVVRIENVTNKVLAEVTDTTDSNERAKLVKKAIGNIEDEATEGNAYKANVKEMYSGNEYYLFVYEEFGDVRFVGAPPSSIGKFGGDTDNWMWPRHTGDFSIFRVYMAPDGTPTKEFKDDNIPYKPLHHLPISLDGIKEGDFTMIMGYPGQTERYLTSYGMKYKMNTFDPILVNIFGTQLEIMKEAMDKDPEIDLALAETYAQLANGHKLFKGEAENLRETDAIQRKEKLEKEFQTWVNANPQRKEKYGNLLQDMKDAYEEFTPVTENMLYTAVGLLQSSSQLMHTRKLMGLKNALENKKDQEKINKQVELVREFMDDIFNEYYPEVDKKVMAAKMKLYYHNMPASARIEFFEKYLPENYKADSPEESIDMYVNDVFENSLFVNRARMESFLENVSDKSLFDFLEKPGKKALINDPLIDFFSAVLGDVMQYQTKYLNLGEKLQDNERLLIEAMMKFKPNKEFYPDANSTLRLTYGTVQDYDPRDAVEYHWLTYVDGIMQKWNPDDDEFQVPEKLVELYKAKDYGRYADETGSVPVCFLSNNDITGGNSGSPILNGKGELIGLAFDGNYEWLCSNLIYNSELQRTINVDSRYVLFIIDKFAEAQNLMDELTIR